MIPHNHPLDSLKTHNFLMTFWGGPISGAHLFARETGAASQGGGGIGFAPASLTPN